MGAHRTGGYRGGGLGAFDRQRRTSPRRGGRELSVVRRFKNYVSNSGTCSHARDDDRLTDSKPERRQKYEFRGRPAPKSRDGHDAAPEGDLFRQGAL